MMQGGWEEWISALHIDGSWEFWFGLCLLFLGGSCIMCGMVGKGSWFYKVPDWINDCMKLERG
jgi:hypothetical protein